MDNIITDVGVGVVISILLLREILPWLLKVNNGRRGNNDGKNGSKQAVTRADLSELANRVQTRDNCEQIVKRVDDTLRGLRDGQRENRQRIDAHFDEVKILLRRLQ